jgi:hypothetical protein
MRSLSNRWLGIIVFFSKIESGKKGKSGARNGVLPQC